jgi:hypothetical protein
MDAVDINTDCRLDISDLVRLVDYMFRHVYFVDGMQLPCGCVSSGSPGAPKINLDIVVTAAVDEGATTIRLASPVNLLGLQLELTGDGAGDPYLMIPNEDLELLWGTRGDHVKMGLVDLEGVASMPSGKADVIRLQGEYQVVSAVVVDDSFETSGAVIENRGKGNLLPEGFALGQNYPNPFNPGTQMEYSLPEAGYMELTVFNVLGQKVAVIAGGYQAAGSHTAVWDGTDESGAAVTSGVYFYRLTQGDLSETRKMVLLK